MFLSLANTFAMQTIYETAKTITFTTNRYDLGGGPIRTILLKGKDSSLILVSPPIHFNENEFKEIEKLGEVSALVAPNKFHNLGVPSWKKRFPKAQIYTSETALPRIKRKLSLDVLNIEDLKVEPDTHFLSCPGTKNGEIVVVCKEKDGWIWYVTDLFFNYVEPPTKWFPRLMVQTITGMGIVVNPFCRFLFIKDKVQVQEWLSAKLGEFPPTAVAFAHGDPIHTPALIQTFKEKVQTYRAGS